MIGFRALKRAGGVAALLLLPATGTAWAAPLTVNVAVNGTWLLLDDRMSEGQYFTGTPVAYDTVNFPTPSAGTSDINEATRYRWTSAGSVRLDLTDWSTVGDGFKVWVDAFNPLTPLATFTGTQWQDIPGCNTTSANDGTGAGCHYYFSDGVDAGDIDASFVDIYMAHGSLIIGPGTHDLVIQGYIIPDFFDGNTQQNEGPFPDATVGMRLTELDVPIPEPASLLLLGSGLLGGAVRLRKKRQPGVKA